MNKITATKHTWVLTTGASSGFGEEFARQYAKQGHSLVLVARRLDRLQTIAATLRQQYRIDVVVEQVDLSDVEAVIQMMQRLRTRGIAIDILINNAGHGVQGPFVDSKLDASLAMLQLDVVSLTAVTHAFAQDMRIRRRGKILLVASLLATRAWRTSQMNAASSGRSTQSWATFSPTEALLAARLEPVSLDDIARQAQPNSFHPQPGAHHYG